MTGHLLFDLDSSKAGPLGPDGYGTGGQAKGEVNRKRGLHLVVKLEAKVQLLVSAGEASGDLYASGVVSSLARRLPNLTFYGCAGPRLQAAGVNPVIDAASLAVVGLAEVVGHLPSIYGEYRRLCRYAVEHPPVGALLTDSPDFHLRVARQMKARGVPVYYLVAPQVWAWRQGRVKTIRELVDKLFCLFPFEEEWFRARGVDATYIGHPLAYLAKVRSTRAEFLERYALPAGKQMVVLLPGSRTGEAARHLPILLDAVRELRKRFSLTTVLATPKGFSKAAALERFREPIAALSIKVIENDTWDCIGHADLALAASGTVTVEAAVLGTPMVTFYRVTSLSWLAGRRLVKVPFLSMVNLIAGRQIVPELIQHDMTASNIVRDAEQLLTDSRKAERMREDLARVRTSLGSDGNPLERAAEIIGDSLRTRMSPNASMEAFGRK
ncbi:MAG: lipid-A-disaccharide synthase [Bryobacteraceae bacterium]